MKSFSAWDILRAEDRKEQIFPVGVDPEGSGNQADKPVNSGSLILQNPRTLVKVSNRIILYYA